MWHPDPDLLALAALPSEQRHPEVEDHLARCGRCRGHVAGLRRTVELAVAGDTGGADQNPPDRVWSAITGELDIVEGPARPRSWTRFALPAAVAAAGVLIGLTVGIGANGAPPAERPLATLVALNGSGATGSVSLVEQDGSRQVVVRLDGAPLPGDADYLEAWLMDATGTRLIALGALAPDPDPDGTDFRGTFTVPADLPLAAFPTVDVSAERWDGEAGHSGVSLLRGDLA